MVRSDQVRDGRYVQGGDTEKKSTNMLGWWERRIFPLSPDDIEFTITSKYSRRPDLLAFDVYGKALHAWILLQYNNINNINTEFVAGKKIRLPTVKRVNTELLTKPHRVTQR